jgi:serine/threonine protein kinase
LRDQLMSVLRLEKAGKYRIESEIGRGAMGVVYRGRDPLIDRLVAIKTILVPDAENAEVASQLARFRREAQASGRLNHPGIVTVYDYGEIDNLCYLVMEFVNGQSLADLMARGERFGLGETLRIIREVLLALEYSHQQGVIHRDIKPANIMLSGDGSVKITDFGVARIESSTLTQSGALLGTPSYMSPEQFTGTPVDQRTDLYSIGILLYEMLTGDKAFSGSLSVVLQKVLHTELPPPSTINPVVPPTLDAIVATAIRKQREQRYADAKQFSVALLKAWAELPESASPPVIATGARSVDSDATLIASPGTDEATRLIDGGQTGVEPPRRRALPWLLALLLASLALYVSQSQWLPIVVFAPPPADAPAPAPAQVPETAAKTPAQNPAMPPATAAANNNATAQASPLTLTSNKGPLPEFSINEELQVLISIRQAAALYCYYEQHNGRVFRIFPNRFRRDPVLAQGEQLRIPDDSMKFRFTFDRPNSVELVHCFAAPQGLLKALPENLLAEDLLPLEVTGIGAVKSAFHAAGGDTLIESALLIRVK